MDHRAFLRSLNPEDKAQLFGRSNAAGLAHLFVHVSLIVGLAVYVAAGLPGWWLALLPLGIAQVFLFALEHEATHKTPFATNWLNELVGRAAGIVILLPFVWFRYFHLAHHKYTNDPARDPELLAGLPPHTKAAYLLHISGVPYWVGMSRQIMTLALGRTDDDFLPKRAKTKAVFEARVMMCLYVLAGMSLFWSTFLLWVWIIPVLLGQPALRLYLMAEHGRCAHVENMFLNTRTTFTNAVVRFLAWNMPYHVEHHSAPQVPFHKLSELHLLTKKHLVETSPGYLEFQAQYLEELN